MREIITIAVVVVDEVGRELAVESHEIRQPKFDELPPKHRERYLFDAVKLMRSRVQERLLHAR